MFILLLCTKPRSFSSGKQLAYNEAKMHVPEIVNHYNCERLRLLEAIHMETNGLENKHSWVAVPAKNLRYLARALEKIFVSGNKDDSSKNETWKAGFAV